MQFYIGRERITWRVRKLYNSLGWTKLSQGGIYMRPGWTQSGMNLYWYERFAAVYINLRRDSWCLVSGWNDMFWLINIWLTQKQYKLEISGPSLRFAVIYQPRSQVSVQVSCKLIKRNVWRLIHTHAGLSSSRSHVNTSQLPRETTAESWTCTWSGHASWKRGKFMSASTASFNEILKSE